MSVRISIPQATPTRNISIAAGNVLHVHDLVDFVSMEAERLADAAAMYVEQGKLPECPIAVETDSNIGHVIPQKISGTQDVMLSMRVRGQFKDCRIVVKQGDRILAEKKMKKALPAEMIQIPIKAERIVTSGGTGDGADETARHEALEVSVL